MPYDDVKNRFNNVCSGTQTRIQESAASRSACKLGGVRVIRQLREPLHSAARTLKVHDSANSDNPNTPRRGFRWKTTTRIKTTRNTATKTTNYQDEWGRRRGGTAASNYGRRRGRHETDHDEDEDEDEKDEDCSDMLFARNLMYLPKSPKREANHAMKTSLRRQGATTPPSWRHCAGIAG